LLDMIVIDSVCTTGSSFHEDSFLICRNLFEFGNQREY
jgi:hypothetical protein